MRESRYFFRRGYEKTIALDCGKLYFSFWGGFWGSYSFFLGRSLEDLEEKGWRIKFWWFLRKEAHWKIGMICCRVVFSPLYDLDQREDHDDVLTYIESVLGKGCKACLWVEDWSDISRGFLVGDHLIAIDRYYEWYGQNIWRMEKISIIYAVEAGQSVRRNFFEVMVENWYILIDGGWRIFWWQIIWNI